MRERLRLWLRLELRELNLEVIYLRCAACMCAFKEAFIGEEFCAVEGADGGQVWSSWGWWLVLGVRGGYMGWMCTRERGQIRERKAPRIVYMKTRRRTVLSAVRC